MMTRVEVEPKLIIDFENRHEVRSLYEELHTWTPNGGWSAAAEQFFRALREAGAIRDPNQ
jgi:hypothetical protein